MSFQKNAASGERRASGWFEARGPQREAPFYSLHSNL